MSYHRSKFVRRTRRQPTDLGDAMLDFFMGKPTPAPAPAPAAPSSTWSPTTADQKAKAAAGCTPLEIVASPGTSPYISCQNKVAKAAGGGGGGGIATGLANLLGGLVANAVNPSQPQAPMVAPSSGLTTGTTVAIGAGLLGILYVVLKD